MIGTGDGTVRAVGLRLITLATLFLLFCTVAFTLTTAWLRVQSNRLRKRWVELERRWEPTIMAVLAGEREGDALRDLVGRGDKRRFVSYLLRYARQLKGPEAKAVRQLAAPYLAEVATDLHHRHPERRARALQTLGELSVATYSREFLRALDDPSPLVAMNAAQALAREYDPAYAEPLLRALARFERWSISFLAALLTTMGTDSAPALREALVDPSRPPRVRAVVAVTLTALNDAAAVPLAARLIAIEHDIDLVVTCLRLIEKLGGEEELPAVRQLLSASHHAIRARAIRTLSGIGAPEDLARIKAALADDSNWVVLHAVRGLGKLGELDHLRRLADSDHHGAMAAREVLWGASTP